MSFDQTKRMTFGKSIPGSVGSGSLPNYVIVLADDLGACDLGAYGNPDADTPALDQLHQISLRHEAFYVTPTCAPTRAALLTGRHHLRTGVAGVHGGKDHINLSEKLLPEWLKEAGYATGFWGKWHSGTAHGYLPHQRGFDEALRLRLYKHRNPVGILPEGDPIPFDGQWADDVIVTHALDFAKRHRDRPFLALVSSMSPHGPIDAPEEEVERFMRERYLTRPVATLHAQVALFDRAVGRLVEGLEQLDAGDRESILIFLSDNGPAMLENDWTNAERTRRNATGWRGWKGDVWEGGVKTPFYLHRIGHPTSVVIDQPADVTDLLPTLLAWSGIEPGPADKPFDGRDIQPMLSGEAMPAKPIFNWVHPAVPPYPGRSEERRRQDEFGPVDPETKAALDPADQVMALRVGDWKLTRNADLNKTGRQPRVFFGNVKADPRETTDLAERLPRKREQFQCQLDLWFNEICKEPQSFQPPLLIIPAQGDLSIQAPWASYLSPDLYNEVRATQGFERAGQMVRWNLRVSETRELQAAIVWSPRGHPPAGTRFALRSGDAEVLGLMTAGGGTEWDGPLMLDAGPTTLEFELLEIPPSARNFELESIRLDAPRPPPDLFRRDVERTDRRTGCDA